MPNLPMALGAVYKQWKNINRKDLGRIIKRLEKQEMLDIQEDGDVIRFIITEKGKRRLLEYNFGSLELKTKKRDGRWRLIIFDIPEDKKKSRDAFSKKLRELGCIRLQDSVYASAFPCKSEVDFLCHFLDISDFVTLANLNKIERGEELIFKKFIHIDE
jgi:phenylacetic acid degradation operon negative regulatory protein